MYGTIKLVSKSPNLRLASSITLINSQKWLIVSTHLKLGNVYPDFYHIRGWTFCKKEPGLCNM